MTLRTRLGNLGNILDESQEQCEHLLLESPVLTNAEFQAMRDYMGATAAVVVDCTFPVTGGQAEQDCRTLWSGSAATPRTPCAAATAVI